MTDFTEANGATRVIPGSQEWPVDLAHSADATRTGLNLTYCASWLRQEENQYLSCPLEVAQELDDDLLKLMGYQLGAYALGYVDDVRSPLDAIRGTVGATGFRAWPRGSLWSGADDVGRSKGHAEPDTSDDHGVELFKVDISGNLVVLFADIALQVTQVDELSVNTEVTGIGVGIGIDGVHV